MQIKVEIRGLKRLQASWAGLPAKIQKMTNDALMRSGYLVEREAKLRTPVATGRLRDSISVSSSLALRTKPHVVISPHTEYAIYVHERKARHAIGDWKFMQRGYNAAKERIREEMQKLLTNLTKEMK